MAAKDEAPAAAATGEEGQARERRLRPAPPQPTCRRLRVFAFDPGLGTRLATAALDQATIEVPWEGKRRAGGRHDSALSPGPVGEYLEVVDVDPASGCFYPPVDLDDPLLLAQNGLPPSEGDPRFHQQMVYAVAMKTIRHFEEALGRRALWSPHRDESGGRIREEYVGRLRIYPHALREPNAYYSPAKKALLFGYFLASRRRAGDNLPGGLVFTCLSHDVVAHETTHALLDGMHRRFLEPSNPDVLALHEAFADVVALLQHFTLPEVLRHQIARTRGDLGEESLLGELAQQFGQAIGHRGALRSALGERDEEGRWHRRRPDPSALARTEEPHARGAILVAALFDAFVAIYRRRTADLVRIATAGTGVLPAGDIHPDLVERLASEAAKSAGHLLRMAIRALDYCPPVDVTFGDYLRALVTADTDLVPDDRRGYRVALIESFRAWGILPHDVRSLSQESLLWQPPGPRQAETLRQALEGAGELRRLSPDWGLDGDRRKIAEACTKNAAALHRWLSARPQAVEALGLTFDAAARASIYRPRHGRTDRPALEVHAVRPSYRHAAGGRTRTDLVVELTQRRRGWRDREVQRAVDEGRLAEPPPPDFVFRGGATLLVDLADGRVRYAIRKSIDSDRRLEGQRRYLAGEPTPSLAATYFGEPHRSFFRGEADEPLALLHRAPAAEEA